MKSSLVTLLFFFVTFVIIDLFWNPADKRILFQPKGPLPVPDFISQRPQASPKSPVPPSKPGTTPAPAADRPTSPVATAAPGPSSEFVPPSIASLEEATKNWTDIPARAFPRPVTLKKPVSITMKVGSGQLAAGTSSIALSAHNGILTIAPSEGSDARGQILVIDTDLPEQIQPAYEKWRDHRIELARQAHARRQPPSTLTLISKNTTHSADPGGKPVANTNGSYNVLLESMHIGQVTEIQPENIIRWGSPKPATVNGQPGWQIDVEFHTTTIFGPFDVMAHAEILDGKVQRWIYTGSGEEVP
jgi:hypothetical protein